MSDALPTSSPQSSDEKTRVILDAAHEDWCVGAAGIFGAVLWSKQEEILSALQHNRRVAVVACSDSGKSYLAALMACLYLVLHPRSIVVTTAPTMRQVKNIIWREIRRIAQESRLSLPAMPQTTQWELSPNWYAIGLSTKDIERVKGFHSQTGHVLVVIDEGPGVPQAIWEAADTLMTQGHAKLLTIGNAGGATGEFYEAFASKRAEYKTFMISALDTPNLTGEGGRTWEGLITREYVEEKKRTWGVDSPMFRAKILAQFVKSSPDALIPLDWIEQCFSAEHEDSEWENGAYAHGTDVARYGDSHTVTVTFKGPKLLRLNIRQGQDLMRTCGDLVTLLGTEGTEANTIDDGGLGGGVTDRLRELEKPVVPIAFGEKAREPNRFVDRRSEMYWNFREAVRERKPILDRSIEGMDDMTAQLTTIKYKTLSDARIKVESKDEMRKRGIASPDEADAVVLAWEARLLATSGGLEPVDVGEDQSESEPGRRSESVFGRKAIRREPDEPESESTDETVNPQRVIDFADFAASKAGYCDIHEAVKITGMSELAVQNILYRAGWTRRGGPGRYMKDA